MKIKSVIAAASVLLAPHFANAQMQLYGGANLGVARWAVDAQVEKNLPSGLTLSKHDAGAKLYLGLSVLPVLAVEAGYANLGSLSVSNSVATASLDGKGFFLDGVAMLPLGSSELSLLGRAGLFAGTSTYSESIYGYTAYSEDISTTGLKFGAGLDYKFSSRTAFRVEWERYKLKAADASSSDSYQDVDLVTVGLRYSF